MKIILKIIGVLACFVLLAMIRFWEDELFYDPLISFFKGNYMKQALPEFNFWNLLGFTFLRFGLNTFISMLALWIAFRDWGVLRFSLILYTIVFVLVGLAFALLLKLDTDQYFLLFYVRRFLIQPLLILLLLPAFYYQKSTKKTGD